MTNQVEATLRQIIQDYGMAILEEHGRCRGLLLDLCGQHKREVKLLIRALEEGIPKELAAVSDRTLLQPLIARLAKRLVDEDGLAEDKAFWSVRTWASVLQPAAPPGEKVRLRDAQALGTRGTTFRLRSTLPLQVFVCPPGQMETSEWRYLGNTPGELIVPPQHFIHVVPQQLHPDTFRQLADDLGQSGVLHSMRLVPATGPTDSDVVNLATSLALVALDLSGCEHITDAALASLCCLSNLQVLSLRGCWRITDSGLQHVANLAYLVVLDLSECRNITNLGLQYLRVLEHLEELYVGGCSGLTAARVDRLALANQARIHKTGYANMPGT